MQCKSFQRTFGFSFAGSCCTSHTVYFNESTVGESVRKPLSDVPAAGKALLKVIWNMSLPRYHKQNNKRGIYSYRYVKHNKQTRLHGSTIYQLTYLMSYTSVIQHSAMLSNMQHTVTVIDSSWLKPPHCPLLCIEVCALPHVTLWSIRLDLLNQASSDCTAVMECDKVQLHKYYTSGQISHTFTN